VAKAITLLTSGTRGDVQPYVALGLGLQAAGYRVSIATHGSFRTLVERHGLSFALIEGNPSELMTRPGGQSALTFDGNWARSARATLDYIRAARPLYERMLASAWQACRAGDRAIDALLIGLPTTWGTHIAEALQIPCLGCFLQPFGRTREFPSALVPSTFSPGPVYNWLTYLAVEQALWQPWRSIINRWRYTLLHLPPVPLTGHRLQAPVLYGFSPQVVRRPNDWPSSDVITGYWFLDEPSAWTPPAELAHFLNAGPPPVYIGFGSPGTRQPLEMVASVVCALDTHHLRGVLALAGEMENLTLPDTILPVAEAPHAWLFPRMAAVVHHGGAGTTAASLRAGVPTLVVPLAVDQFFWGKRVEALGVGPRPLPQRALNAARLAQALGQATQVKAMQARAQALGKAIQAEDGVQRAVEIIRSMV